MVVEIAFRVVVDRCGGVGHFTGVFDTEVAVQPESGQLVLPNRERISACHLFAHIFVDSFGFFDANFGHVVLALLHIQEGEHDFVHFDRDAVLLSVENNVERVFRLFLRLGGICAETEKIALHIDSGLGGCQIFTGGGQFIRRVRGFFCAVAGKSGGECAQAQHEGEKSAGKMLHKR